jgi:hypothetical protein
MNRRVSSLLVSILATVLSACSSEVLEKQAEQIKQQELEIARQRKDLEAMLAGQKLQDQKQQDCNRAFREYFEKAQYQPIAIRPSYCIAKACRFAPMMKLRITSWAGLWPSTAATLRLKGSLKRRSILSRTLPMPKGTSRPPGKTDHWRIETQPYRNSGSVFKIIRVI